MHRHRERRRFVTVAQQPIEERRKIGDSALKIQVRDVVVVKEAPLNFRLADDGGGTASVEALQIGDDMFVVPPRRLHRRPFRGEAAKDRRLAAAADVLKLAGVDPAEFADRYRLRQIGHDARLSATSLLLP